jgi:hypothetical protein
MRMFKSRLLPAIVMTFTIAAAGGFAQAAPAGGADPASIPPGTQITMQNWQHYRQFMPEGMQSLFEGKYHWKMPSDVQINVGPTIVHPLPKNYVAATEKFSPQVRIANLPDGGMTIENYQGGLPFPTPAEPHRAWKVMTDVWYRYLPHTWVDTYGLGCTENGYGSISCSADEIVAKQLSFNTDPGIPATIPGARDKFYTEWIMTLEPENQRYTASLVISYADPRKAQDVYVFLPALRRSQRVSAAARCTPFTGTDATSDDYRFGFNANITEMQAADLGDRKILALVDATPPPTRFPDGFDMPLGWPKPSWGKWQVRDVYTIDARKIPSLAAGYCYGRRVMYVDKASFAPLWEDMYDAKLKPWKFYAVFLSTIDVPGVGPVNSNGSAVEGFWDIQNNHSTFFSDPGQGHPFYVNEQAPAEYQDLTRYSTASGLDMIMR